MRITYADFIREVEAHNGEMLPTVGGRAVFRLRRTEHGVCFTPKSTRRPRPLRREHVENYLRLFNRTQSLNTSTYAKDHRNQSYVLAIIELILDQRRQARRVTGATSSTEDIDAEFTAREGAARIRLHWHKERSRALAQMAKRAFRVKHGRLFCQVCGFDFAKTYGDPGFIEVHHLIPLRELKASQRTKLSDLALVCANCHRMLHRGSRWPTLDELRARIRATEPCH